jgi:hypothetical protein
MHAAASRSPTGFRFWLHTSSKAKSSNERASDFNKYSTDETRGVRRFTQGLRNYHRPTRASFFGRITARVTAELISPTASAIVFRLTAVIPVTVARDGSHRFRRREISRRKAKL